MALASVLVRGDTNQGDGFAAPDSLGSALMTGVAGCKAVCAVGCVTTSAGGLGIAVCELPTAVFFLRRRYQVMAAPRMITINKYIHHDKPAVLPTAVSPAPTGGAASVYILTV